MTEIECGSVPPHLPNIVVVIAVWSPSKLPVNQRRMFHFSFVLVLAVYYGERELELSVVTDCFRFDTSDRDASILWSVR